MHVCMHACQYNATVAFEQVITARLAQPSHCVVFFDRCQHGGALWEDGAEGLELRQSDDGEELRTEKLKQKS